MDTVKEDAVEGVEDVEEEAMKEGNLEEDPLVEDWGLLTRNVQRVSEVD